MPNQSSSRNWIRYALFLILATVLISVSPALANPAISGQWTPTASLHQDRYQHTATLLPDGNVLVAGGYGSAGYLATAEIYTTSLGIWTFTGSMTTKRAAHAAALLGNGKVLVAGGEDGSNDLATAEIYDPVTHIWTPTGSMNVARKRFTATVLKNGMVLVVGGWNTQASASA